MGVGERLLLRMGIGWSWTVTAPTNQRSVTSASGRRINMTRANHGWLYGYIVFTTYVDSRGSERSQTEYIVMSIPEHLSYPT